MSTDKEIQVVGDALKIHGRRHADRVAIIYQNESYTYGQILDRANRLSNALLEIGVKKGNKVSILVHNIPEYTICYFAVANIGAVNVPVNVHFKSREIQYGIEQSDSIAMILTEQFLEEFEPIRPRIEQLKGSILIQRIQDDRRISYSDLQKKEPDTHRKAKSFSKEDYLLYDRIIENYPAEDPEVHVTPDDEHVFWYTSGTTGFPKAAILNHAASLFATKNFLDSWGQTRHDSVLMVTPVFHNAYQAFGYGPHYLGGTLVLMESFSIRKVLDEIQRCRPSIFFGVPAIFTLLLDFPELEKYDISSIRKMIFGAAPMSLETIKKMQSTFNCELYHVYGQSEYCPGISTLRNEDILRKPASIGSTLNNEIAIMDENNSLLPSHSPGEICCRGKGMMKGYYKKPEETANTIRDGWLHTNDMGYMDEEGFLYFLGRKDDMINRGGENIHPRDIEEVLYMSEKVRDAAVIGVPDSVMGEAIKAFVVLKEGSHSSPDEIQNFCRENMADYKIPRYVEICPELPLNPSGKIVKTVLKEKEISRYKELGPKAYEKRG